MGKVQLTVFAKATSEGVNLFFALLALVFIVLLVVSFLGAVQQVSDILPTVPEAAYYYLIGISAFILVLSVVGFVATFKNRKKLFIAYVVVAALFFLIQFILALYFILYGNGIPVFQQVDDFAADLQQKLEDKLVELAEEKPEDWVDIQNSFECCGVDAFSLLQFDEFDKTLEEFIASQITGQSPINCTLEVDELIEIYQNITASGLDNEEDVEDFVAAAGIPDDFFCKDKISAQVEEYTIYISAGIGIYLFFQAYLLICAIILLRRGFHVEKGLVEFELRA